MPLRSTRYRITYLSIVQLGLVVLSSVATAQSDDERRIIVGGLNESGHFVYSFKGERPLLHVRADEPKLPKTLRLTNRSGRNLKLLFYNGGDKSRLVARSSVTLANGKSHSLPFRVYSAKVFEVGVLDKLVLTSSNFVSDAEIRSRTTDGKRSYVLTSVRHAFSVQNNTRETLEVSVFNRSDTARVVPRFVLTCPPQETTRWQDPPIEPFRIRVHPNRVLAAPISTDRLANAHTAVVIESHTWSPGKALMRRTFANGRLQETREPLVLPMAGNLNVDPFTLTNSGSSSNRLVPLLIGRTSSGKLFLLKLEDGVLIDGMTPIQHSTDWRLQSTGEGESWSFGRFESTPSLADQLLLFARGRDDDLIYKPMYQSATARTMNENGEWKSLGGKMTGRPSAVSFDENGEVRHMVFTRSAADGSVLCRSSNADGRWGAWQNLGGKIVGDPAACTSITGSYSEDSGGSSRAGFKSRIHLFARSVDGALMHREWNEGVGWKSWEPLGGPLASSPFVHGENILTGTLGNRSYTNRIHVTAKNPEGETLYRFHNGSKWSAWQKIPVTLVSDPIVFESTENS